MAVVCFSYAIYNVIVLCNVKLPLEYVRCDAWLLLDFTFL